MNTPDPRTDKLAELHRRLADEVAALRTGEDWRRWLTAASRLHEYSFQNTLLILSQRPDATTVAGYETWKALGRQVNRGEKGIAVMAPILRRTQRSAGEPPDPATEAGAEATGHAVGRAVAGFRVTYVWDVSQTSGPSLPAQPTAQPLTGQAPPGLWEVLAELTSDLGFTVERRPVGGANGLTDFGGRAVLVRPDVDDAQAVKTLAHELGHVRLHAPDAASAYTGQMSCRGLLEVEAESVAYLVTAAHGLDSGGYTFPYVTSWATDVRGHKPEDVVRITGERVLTAARWILTHTQTAVPTSSALTGTPTQDRARVVVVAPDVSWNPRMSVSGVAREQLVEVHAEALRFFRTQVERSWVPAYLRGRGLGAALDSQWEAGRAPAGWTGLVAHLRTRGVDDDTLLASGLTVRARTGRLIDTFRERLMLPLRDDDGAVIGFIGRAHPDASSRTPKYLNSRATTLYRKDEHVYGLYEAQTALARGAAPVLVEGPLDAIAVSASMPGRAVGLAACGTALTGAQADRLIAASDLGRQPLAVGFDADPAGFRAAEHAALLLSIRGVEAMGVSWRGGDAAETLHAYGTQALIADVQGYRERLDDLIVDRRMRNRDGNPVPPSGRCGSLEAVARLLAALPTDVVDRQSDRVATALDVDRASVVHAINAARTQAPGPMPDGPSARGWSGLPRAPHALDVELRQGRGR